MATIEFTGPVAMPDKIRWASKPTALSKDVLRGPPHHTPVETSATCLLGTFGGKPTSSTLRAHGRLVICGDSVQAAITPKFAAGAAPGPRIRSLAGPVIIRIAITGR